ncbi:uncharacterized protein LOC114520834 [Dendronephthya gigantea]|uniref:uncharacterized protein LOC114520834 n=1 Tax=Dendronephthya gigantea TaxID=151771 RepID=UPI0010695AF9|nr:uncharacterized protein LOC114520834 [Dendronephthya gigantea]XP_028396969.1 uncharacterized protein LOC114520834 [Dendronephthya gigantea]XP_028396970.1 uncharacterized protein LOC114520834 [Dendronephthya gigantea]
MGCQKLAIVLAISFSWISLAHFDNHQQTVRGETNRIVKRSPLNHQDIHASARSAVTNVFNDPNQPCYKRFFVDNQPPIGLRPTPLPATSQIKYICQQIPTATASPTPVTYYATMFDENHGIAVYSAYYVNKRNMDDLLANKFGRKDEAWRTQPGITKQGTDAVYQTAGKSTYDKGHLLPANIYSFSAEHVTSTFSYTNAVPQVGKFNKGEWKQYEGKILDFAIDICTQRSDAVLYLITGTTVNIRYGDNALTGDKILKGQSPVGIKVPGSMWTAGCCLAGASTGKASVTSNFAVIGGNLGSLKMAELSVGALQTFLTTDPGVTAGAVNLFPGHKDCSNPAKMVNLKKTKAGAPTGGTPVKVKKPSPMMTNNVKTQQGVYNL